jgi:hypothetical protein
MMLLLTSRNFQAIATRLSLISLGEIALQKRFRDERQH